MTYLIRRGSTWHFRFRLPDDLRGREAPARLPARLQKLVNGKTKRFKHELTESLRTRENSAARARGGVLIADSELLVTEARRFLSEGAPATLPPDVIEFLAERRVHEMLATDDRLRSKGLGLDLTPIRSAALASLAISPDAAGTTTDRPSRPGMTLDDLDLLRFATDRVAESLRLGVALRQAPEWVKAEVDRALDERGASLEPDSDERRDVEVSFLAATQRAIQSIQSRNSGSFTPTPAPPADPSDRLGPLLSQAFAAWQRGTLLPGMKAPRARTAQEAEFSVRRFTELYGDVRIGAITRDQARGFLDAMWRLPTRLPADIERLRLPAILARGDIAKYPRRAVGTLVKHITLLTAIVGKAGDANDLAFNGSRWSNPFDGLKPKVQEERERESFSTDELTRLFATPIYVDNDRPVGGAGEASFWLPVLGLLTGARLGELAQLRLADVRRDGPDEPLNLDINQEGEGRYLKTKSSRRKVPVHPALMDIGFVDYVTARRREAPGDIALLFPGLATRGGRQPGAQWSKWFGRWRKDKAGLVTEASARKDFHSFRHTFKDLCRTAKIPEDVHDALTGHAGGGVGRGYGSGVPLTVLAEAIGRLEVPRAISGLRWNGTIGQASRG